MLTTFNEIDMSRVKALRKRFGEEFQQKHGVRLGIMSFFLKASVAALKETPEINAFIEGNEIVYHNYYHLGVAIGAQRGLVVPVIRDADRLGFADMSWRLPISQKRSKTTSSISPISKAAPSRSPTVGFSARSSVPPF